MITNERQYKITKSQAKAFRKALDEFNELALIAEGIDPLIAKAQQEGLRSQLGDLEQSISRFERLREGSVRELSCTSLEKLGSTLIEARIASGLTQRALADKLGVKEQQIQRYEQEGYRAANLIRLAEILEAIAVSVEIKITIGSEFEGGRSRPSSVHERLKMPAKEMRRRGWFERFERRKNKPFRSDVDLAHLYIEESLGATPVLHKRTYRLDSRFDEGALLAWQARVMDLARGSAARTDWSKITDGRFVKELASLSVREDGPERAIEMLNGAGVRVVVERHLPKTYLDGAAMLLDGKDAIVALTLRHDRLDNFWFVLFHELGHIVRHRNRGLEDGFFDEESAEAKIAVEEEADDFARNALIPDELWQSSLVRYASSADKIRAFAKRAGVHESIIAGRIRRERNDYTIFSSLVGRNKLRATLSCDADVLGGYVDA